jgi:hypothetical protein
VAATSAGAYRPAQGGGDRAGPSVAKGQAATHHGRAHPATDRLKRTGAAQAFVPARAARHSAFDTELIGPRADRISAAQRHNGARGHHNGQGLVGRVSACLRYLRRRGRLAGRFRRQRLHARPARHDKARVGGHTSACRVRADGPSTGRRTVRRGEQGACGAAAAGDHEPGPQAASASLAAVNDAAKPQRQPSSRPCLAGTADTAAVPAPAGTTSTGGHRDAVARRYTHGGPEPATGSSSKC